MGFFQRIFSRKKENQNIEFEPVIEIVPAFGEEEPSISTEQKENKAAISLKEVMTLASSNTKLTTINKKTVADYLENKYAEQVIVNRRENYILSGYLPLPDTHYKKIGNKSKCFIYVYELKNEKVFFLLRADENSAKQIQNKHPSFKPSAFPKSKKGDWFTLFIDDSFQNKDEVFETISLLYENFNLEK